MQPTKNQFALAELKFSYQTFKQSFFANEQELSANFFMDLYHESKPASTNQFYAVFINNDEEILCWYLLPEVIDIEVSCKQMAGLAIACNASGISIVHCSNADRLRFGKFDRFLMLSCFTACDVVGIQLIDYLSCSPMGYISFKNEFLN
ncbi:JAB domain-containing protein [Pedobacter nototheniae]|uniref:JAB domain-containing protein n=1 Tax=Pedobacter nototheniae TaxID=2488994 RepID=UPI00103B96C5|nr:JAB domain-containing protein [Pedobacter nototheniae]